MHCPREELYDEDDLEDGAGLNLEGEGGLMFCKSCEQRGPGRLGSSPADRRIAPRPSCASFLLGLARRDICAEDGRQASLRGGFVRTAPGAADSTTLPGIVAEMQRKVLGMELTFRQDLTEGKRVLQSTLRYADLQAFGRRFGACFQVEQLRGLLGVGDPRAPRNQFKAAACLSKRLRATNWSCLS